MTSRDSTQVRPAEIDGWEQEVEKKPKETINLYEVLEDRYAYEGFNKFIFYCFVFFAIYQWILSSFRNVDDIAGHVNLIRNKIIPPSKDLFEREEFNAWGLNIMKGVIDNPKFFGDKYNLMRITVQVEPTLCNSTNHHPHNKLDSGEYDANGIRKDSFLKSYEQEFGCSAYSSMGDKKGQQEIMLLLESKYGVYSVYDERSQRMTIPMYSAELHPQNKSKIVEKQFEGLKKALAAESKGLRLRRVMIEVLNPYEDIVLMPSATIPDTTIKHFQLYIRSHDTISRHKNTRFIAWTIVSLLCSACMFYNLVSKLWNKSKESLQKMLIGNLYESFCELVILPCFLFQIIYNWGNEIIYMDHPLGTVKTIEETTTWAKINSGHNAWIINANTQNAQYLGVALIFDLILMLKHLSWHSGTSVLTSTISNAFGDIMDTTAVVLLLLTGFGAFGYSNFGIGGGSYDFLSFGSGFNTMARLSFGMLDYHEFMSDGYGHGYDGIGLANFPYLKYIMLWVSFILLSTIIVNILIAVMSDGFEIHKDKQRLRTKSGQTFFAYALHRLMYFTCFLFFPCCKKLEPSWVEKMRFTSSNHAKTLLKYTDALPDGMVFDQKLQDQVIRRIIGQEDDEKKSSSGALRIVRTKSLSIKKITKSDVINSKDIITDETSHDFFSNLNSKKTLRLVIDTIFEIACEATKKTKAMKSFQSNDGVYDKIWNLYRHSEEQRKEKEEARVEGNHVRKVVKPMEARLKKEIAGIKAEMQEMKQKMEEDIQEIKSLLLKIANK
eukprot:g3586.t1